MCVMPTPTATTSVTLPPLSVPAAIPSPTPSPNSLTTINGGPTTVAVGRPRTQTIAAQKVDIWAKCYRALRMSCAATLAILGMIAAYWTLMVTFWTAEKDFRDDCRSQNATIGRLSAACLEELKKDLQAPPIRLEFHDKRSEVYLQLDWEKILTWPDKWIHSQYELSYYAVRRPKSSVMTISILTIACLLCPAAYLFWRAYLLRSHRRTLKPTSWIPHALARATQSCMGTGLLVSPTSCSLHEFDAPSDYSFESITEQEYDQEWIEIPKSIKVPENEINKTSVWQPAKHVSAVQPDMMFEWHPTIGKGLTWRHWDTYTEVLRPSLMEMLHSTCNTSSRGFIFRIRLGAWDGKVGRWPRKTEERIPSVIISLRDSEDREVVKKTLGKSRWLRKEASGGGLQIVVIVDPGIEGYPVIRF